VTTTVPKPKRRPTLRERLLSKAVINWETGCWEWTASKTGDGYGKLGVNGKTRDAHAVAYELIEGPVPDGLELDHTCRVRRCINPAHLEPVTHRENMLRAPYFGSDTHCKAGHEWTEENTYTYRAQRCCRACNAASHKQRYVRRADRQEVAA
jgi:hypothetical protein